MSVERTLLVTSLCLFMSFLSYIAAFHTTSASQHMQKKNFWKEIF